MAFTMPASKHLKELLQEQQEPFSLEIYLLEKGYLRSNLSFSHINSSSSFLKRSTSLGGNKGRKIIPHCSKILKAFFNKFVSNNNSRKLKNSPSGHGNGNGNSSAWETSRSNQTAESDRFSSASSTTAFHSCSESDTKDGANSSRKEVITDGKPQWRGREDSKELSPVSVLEELPTSVDSPIHNRQKNATRDSSTLAVSFCKFILESSMEEPNGSDSSSQYLAAKRVLQHSKQLLFDCARELIENRARRHGRSRRLLEFLGPEKLGKLVCENVRTWSKLSGNETNTTQLLNSEFSVGEWSDFELQMRDISAEIGDAILEDISKEIVVDMIALVEQHSGQAS